MSPRQLIFMSVAFAILICIQTDLSAEPAPEWATTLKEAQKLFATKVVRWWIDHPPCPTHGKSGSGVEGGQKQIGTGEFGGDINDDVELTDGWATLFLTAHDKEVAKSIRWLFDSAWSDGKTWKYTKAYARHVHGYRDTKWDRCPEHSSETAVYTIPQMMFVEHGNPRHIEQLMDTSEHFWIWTKVNPAGHRHFRSYLIGPYGVYKVKEIPQDELVPWDDPKQQWEIAECARPMKAGNFLLWYNMNPKLKLAYKEWYDAWLAKAKRTDGGKPYGVLPGGVTWATDALGGNTGDWRYADPPGTAAHSYDWEQGWPMAEIHHHFLTAYLLFNDERYLLPTETLVEYVLGIKSHPDIKAMWPDLVQAYRLLTGRTRFDSHLLSYKPFALQYNFLKYLTTGKKEHLQSAATECANFIAKNIYNWTESPKMANTDKGNEMYYPLRTFGHFYTGGDAVIRSRYPGSLVVSWENTGYEFAALVLAGQRDKTRCKAAIYSFETAEKTIGMRVWQLEKGLYKVTLGPDTNHDEVIDSVSSTQEVNIVERGQTIQFSLPPQRMYIVEVTQIKADGISWTELTDLAAVTADVTLAPPNPASGEEIQATVTIHNISSVDANNIEIAVLSGLPASKGKRLATKTIPTLAAPKDLDMIFPDCKNRAWPKTTQVSLNFTMPPEGNFYIHIDPENSIPEMCERNNIIAYKNGILISPAEIEGSGDFAIYPRF